MKALLSLYSPQFPRVVVYMLQNAEYQPAAYLAWFWRTQNFSAVMYRRTLDRTKIARILLLCLRVGLSVQVLIGLLLVVFGLAQQTNDTAIFGLAVILAAPVVWAHLIVVPIVLGKLLIIQPKERQMIAASREIFSNISGVKIAIAGSYGKTTVKELLTTILGEDKKVAATPGNKNVTISHARFARQLQGDEDVVVIEYGEGKPGDVAKFAAYTRPDKVIVTGIAPAHLDQYKTLEAAAADIFSAASHVEAENVYVNGESPDTSDHIKTGYNIYSRKGCQGWNVSDVDISVTGMTFTAKNGQQSLFLQTGLVGEHLIGPIVLAVAVAHELGCTKQQIIDGVAKTKPYEHRMQPYRLGGAWVIDDSYNGNLEGIRAGTQLLAALEARRKIYVTPGLVDQGDMTRDVHEEMGRLIAAAKPDEVVLMRNSVTPHIHAGLEESGYSGKVTFIDRPLEYYTNLEHVVAAGDIVMLQNDWPDNYQ